MYETFETELSNRIFNHKACTVMARIAKQYIDEQSKGAVNLPMYIIQEQAVDLANALTQRIVLNGTLNEAYEEAWGQLSPNIPDNFIFHTNTI